MWEDSAKRRQRLDATYRRKLANSGSLSTEWGRASETWFDGGVESVDRRLAHCRRLLSSHRAALAGDGLGQRHLDKVAELEQQHAALEGLRRDLLTASGDREEPISEVSPSTKPHLASQDQRYVELESAKFFRANATCSPDELAIRARHHAEVQTSTLKASRSRAITAAFVGRVVQHKQEQPRPRVASAPSPTLSCSDEMIFM